MPQYGLYIRVISILDVELTCCATAEVKVSWPARDTEPLLIQLDIVKPAGGLRGVLGAGVCITL